MIANFWIFFFNKTKRKVDYFKNYLKLLTQIAKNRGYIGSYVILRHCECVKIGKGVKFNEQVRIECYPEYLGVKLHPKLIIRENVNIGPNFTALVADSVEIKANSIFAGNVTLISENHGTSPQNTPCYQKEPLQTGPITIGEGCWFGQNVTILPNTIIGDRCIIAANAVVRGNIPSFSMVAGIPARVIKTYNHNTNKWERI